MSSASSNRTGEKFKTRLEDAVGAFSISSTSKQLVDILFDRSGWSWYKHTKGADCRMALHFVVARWPENRGFTKKMY